MKTFILYSKNTLLIVLFSLLFQCKLTKGIEEAIKDATATLVNTLQNSADQLSYQSSDWQSIARATLDEATKLGDFGDDVLMAVKGDLTNTVNRLLPAGGAELRCDADFLRNRLKQDLLRLKAKLLKQNPPDLKPVLCGVSPTGVVLELKPNLIELFGYDLDRQKNIKVFLKNGSSKIDVTDKLSQPTHYHWVLNVSGTNGVNFTNNSHELVVQFGDQEVSSIPVVQPRPIICESEIKDIVTSELGMIDFTPKLINGDREFNNNGPKSYASVRINHDSRRIWATVFMDAIEWCNDKPCGDRTQVQDSRIFNLWTAPAGRTIEKITSTTFQDISYIDSNHDIDQRSSGGELVRFFRFVGDTPGAEAGIRTGVHIEFNKLSISLKEQGDCVSTTEVAQLPLQARMLVLKNMSNTPRLKRQIREAARTQQRE